MRGINFETGMLVPSSVICFLQTGQVVRLTRQLLHTMCPTGQAGMGPSLGTKRQTGHWSSFRIIASMITWNTWWRLFYIWSRSQLFLPSPILLWCSSILLRPWLCCPLSEFAYLSEHSFLLQVLVFYILEIISLVFTRAGFILTAKHQWNLHGLFMFFLKTNVDETL